MKKKRIFLCGMAAFSMVALATPVKITMNATSQTMTLTDSRGNKVETGNPENRVYSFNADPGSYTLTAYDKNGTTVNGTIILNVLENSGSIFGDDLDDQYKDGIDDVNQFTIITCTAYVTNKQENTNTNWNLEDGDYMLDVKVNTREGKKIETTQGVSSTAGRYTFLALNGNSYTVAFVPSEEHKAEGYMTLYKNGTLTANVNVSGAIPQGAPFSISVPKDAEFRLGMKFTHFTDFTPVDYDEVENSDNGKTYKYTLAKGQIYNYRTWKNNGLTNAGYFTMSADESKRPSISFTENDYARHDPKAINHSPHSNNGYETGDIFLNINPQNHLKLEPGKEFLVHAMRTWELTDNSTNNYFFEPDFHYTVLDADFRPSKDVIQIENADTRESAWSKITAKGRGTAIVMVTYDGINLNYYNNAEKREYLGGEYWGAVWPENTGLFVVTVGEDSPVIKSNMVVNQQYNVGTLRLAGEYVDAEHDVFYYLDTEEGFPFIFKPEGTVSVEVATPHISESKVTYTGFSSEGVTKDGESYTVLLKEGRNIIRMTDASGKAIYQVVSAKPCHREITNMTREGSKIFQPGDKIKIQYSGLYHPANKIAGIYNMSAYVTYNHIPNGSSLILGSGQYIFGSAASAQAVTIDIPVDYNVEKEPCLLMNEGVIQVNGYGDPIGNHRNTSPLAGRSPNFTAVPHQTYFGALPDIAIDLSPIKTFEIQISGVKEGSDLQLSFDGSPLMPDDKGNYSGTYGTYSLTVKADGYRCFRKNYEIPDDADGLITFLVDMEELGDAWDGITKSRPELNENNFYEIKTPAELAWFAENVNSKSNTQDAILLNDLHLGNFDWTPIGNSSSSPFKGNFKGQGYTIEGLYINSAKTNYLGLFGYMNGGSISGIEVEGTVSGKQYIGGIVGNVSGASTLDRCANHANVTGTGTYVGGISGYLNSATAKATNLYNTGSVQGTTNCGGLFGSNNKDASVENVFNVGEVKGTTVGACIGGTTAKDKVSNAFSIFEYQILTGQNKVSEAQMTSGEIAYKLGDAFFQTLGEDAYPKFKGQKVFYDEDKNEYYNVSTGIHIANDDLNDELQNDGESEIDIFDISGRTIKIHIGPEYFKTLAPGIYIVRRGNKLNKVIVK